MLRKDRKSVKEYDETKLTDDPTEPGMDEKLRYGFAAMNPDDATRDEEDDLHDPPQSIWNEVDESEE